MPDEKFDDDKFFDDILNDDTPNDKVDEKIADPDGDENKAGDKDKKDDDKKDDGPTMEDRLAALEKENKGLKKAVVENRQGKTQFKTELDDLKGIIETGLKERGAKTADTKDGDNTDVKSEKIDRLPLEFGEDGKGYVKIETLQETMKEMMVQSDEKVNAVKKTLSDKDKLDAVISAREKHISAIINEKPGRDAAFHELVKGVQILDNKVRELIAEKGMSKEIQANGLQPGAALQLLEDSEGALDDFNKLNLGVDLEVVARMMDSDWDLKKALDSYVTKEDTTNKADNEDDKLVEDLKKKPSSHGSVANKKETDTSIVDKVAHFSTEDMLDMDDETVDKLMRRMEREARE